MFKAKYPMRRDKELANSPITFLGPFVFIIALFLPIAGLGLRARILETGSLLASLGATLPIIPRIIALTPKNQLMSAWVIYAGVIIILAVLESRIFRPLKARIPKATFLLCAFFTFWMMLVLAYLVAFCLSPFSAL